MLSFLTIMNLFWYDTHMYGTLCMLENLHIFGKAFDIRRGEQNC